MIIFMEILYAFYTENKMRISEHAKANNQLNGLLLNAQLFEIFNFLHLTPQLYYLINSSMDLTLSQITTNQAIKECFYSASNISFHFIEICNIVFVADTISKEVCRTLHYCRFILLLYLHKRPCY